MSKLIILAIFSMIIAVTFVSTQDFTPTKNPIKVRCYFTGHGGIDFHIEPTWNPDGAKRFLDLVDDGYFSRSPLYRVFYNKIIGFGSNAKTKEWEKKYKPLPEIKKEITYKKGWLGFAEDRSRNMDFVIAMAEDYEYYALEHFDAPIGYSAKVSLLVGQFFAKYGESVPHGLGPDPEKIKEQGEQYLKQYPELDYIISCNRLPDHDEL